ncbi:hypothetical protein MAUB1S_02795 [Mycolicibacterium aubagnense]
MPATAHQSEADLQRLQRRYGLGDPGRSDRAEQVRGGSASALTGDGGAHSVVITTNKLVPTAADWTLRPGAPVAVQAYLTDGKANPDGDPTVAVATLNQTVTATTKPTGTDNTTTSATT